MPVGRRAIVRAISIGTVTGIGGCLSGLQSDGTKNDETYTPFEQGEASEATGCSAGTAVDPRWTAAHPGPSNGFELSVSDPAPSRGEAFEVYMENVTEEEQLSGVKMKYDVQHETEGGWASIYSREGAVLDAAVPHPPDGGFTWRFAASKSGLTVDEEGQRSYHACRRVEPGPYRFVYWGVGDAAESLAIPFEVT